MDEHTLDLSENLPGDTIAENYKAMKEFALLRFNRRQARGTTSKTKEGLAMVDEHDTMEETEKQDYGDGVLFSAPKGKGKGAGLECYTCGGKGHPARLCPTDPNTTAVHTCHTCGGRGHFSRECPSAKGGGKGGKGTKGGFKGTKGMPWSSAKGGKRKRVQWGEGTVQGKGQRIL